MQQFEKPTPIDAKPLAEALDVRYWERWNETNQEAIHAYNDRIDIEGLPLARYRSF